jgi:DNA-binding transcriptional ArsR family regulator
MGCCQLRSILCVYALTVICCVEHTRLVVADPFLVVAEPMRRRILDKLVVSESSVSKLVKSLKVTQPVVSKHLRVLRDAGFVSCRVAAQQRIYRIEPRPFEKLDAWLRPYRRLWTHHLDSLERHLNSQEIP